MEKQDIGRVSATISVTTQSHGRVSVIIDVITQSHNSYGQLRTTRSDPSSYEPPVISHQKKKRNHWFARNLRPNSDESLQRHPEGREEPRRVKPETPSTTTLEPLGRD
jgi:hypothetical protein